MTDELPPMWALDKAAKAAGFLSWRESKISHPQETSTYASIIAHARTIAQYEQPPVDEDEEALVRILNAFGFKPTRLSEYYADWWKPDAALAQFKRELERRK